jgi:hypothetical protein
LFRVEKHLVLHGICRKNVSLPIKITFSTKCVLLWVVALPKKFSLIRLPQVHDHCEMAHSVRATITVEATIG